jgi:hypothetical protein
MKIWKLLVSVIVMALLFGCGSGGGGSETGLSSNTTVYRTGGEGSLVTGHTSTYSLTGSDTAGGTYTGSQHYVVDGPTTIDGRDVIQVRVTYTTTKTGEWSDTNIQTLYYNTDKTVYKIDYSDGGTAVPANNVEIPETVKVGDSGAGHSLIYNNGNTMHSTWQVTDAGGGNATLTYSFYINSKLKEQNIVTLTPSGEGPSFTRIYYDYPTKGVTTVLYGKRI